MSEKLSAEMSHWTTRYGKDLFEKQYTSLIAGWIPRVAKLEEESAELQQINDEKFGITVVDGVRGIDLPEGVKAYFEVTDRVFIKEKDAEDQTE